MKVLDAGHLYALDHVEHMAGIETLRFIKRSGGAIQYAKQSPGTNVQEVLRALIDRTEYLNAIIPCDESGDAAYHLRMALFNYEVRAYRRKQEELNRESPAHVTARSRGHGEQKDVPFTYDTIETLSVGSDGHISCE